MPSLGRGGAGEATLDDCRSEVSDFGLSALEAIVDGASSSSMPNDNLPFAASFRFFFDGFPGVETLCFDN